MALEILLLLLGFGLLIIGANWLVDGSSSLARKFKVSDLAIGLTVVAFGTSTPELVVNLFAAAQGHHNIVFGNIIGSNNFNLFGILGIAGLITPLIVKSSTVWKEIPLSLLAILLLFFLANDFFLPGSNILSMPDGIILLIMFGLFVLYVTKQLKNDVEVQRDYREIPTLKIVSMIILGLVGLVAGGRLVVVNSVEMAKETGISEKIIGLTIVAVGTSLPELATSVVAGIKKNNDIAIGNIIGSNIFNVFFILGISSLLRPQEYNQAFNADILMVAAGTVFVFIAMFAGRKHSLDRWEAALLLASYVGYTFFMVIRG